MKWTKITEKDVIKNPRIMAGNVLSHVSTSFEKRFNTRPNGVVSNSSMGHRKLKWRSIMCISRAAYKHPRASVSELAKVVATEEKVYQVS